MNKTPTYKEALFDPLGTVAGSAVNIVKLGFNETFGRILSAVYDQKGNEKRILGELKVQGLALATYGLIAGVVGSALLPRAGVSSMAMAAA